MANPRQRRKAKSANHKVVSHSKRAKRLLKKMPAIRGPKALQDAWDPSKTVRQNYSALGLVHDLNPIASGGSEVSTARTSRQTHAESTDDRLSPIPEARTVAAALAKGFGRIVRDSSGNVIRVELPDEEEVPEQEPSVDVSVKLSESEVHIWTHVRPAMTPAPGAAKGATVRDLENLAACTTARERHTSLGEKIYLERLVKKYGYDLQKMARDRRLNPAQRTANELKRAIAKTGGFITLSRCPDQNITE